MKIARKKKAPLRGYALAVEVLAQIEVSETDRSLPQWDQTSWGRTVLDIEGHADPEEVRHDPITNLPVNALSCGTAFCFAGWADVLGDKPIVWSDDHGLGGNELVIQTPSGVVSHAIAALELAIPTERDEQGNYIHDSDEEFWSLDEPMLFDAGNDLDDLYYNVAGLYDKTIDGVRQDVHRRIPDVRSWWADRVTAKSPQTESI